jgi:hypothetical protein
MTELQYVEFTMEEWAGYPKDGFSASIRGWCERHGFMQQVQIGHSVPCKLPYKSENGKMYCAKDFLERVGKRNARKIYQTTIK